MAGQCFHTWIVGCPLNVVGEDANEEEGLVWLGVRVGVAVA